MEKITLSLRSLSLKKQIRAYAMKRSLSVSGIVENYLRNLIKIEENLSDRDFNLPVELDNLLDGVEVDKKLKIKDYKTLRDEMYANRTA
jgi:hypothetical protein